MSLSEECRFLMCSLGKTFNSAGTGVLTVRIEYPKFELPECGRMETIIDRCIWGRVECLFHSAATILFHQAACAPHSVNDSEDEVPFHLYDVVLQYQVTACNSCYVGLYYDVYEYTGGAHGNTIRRSDTWSLKACRAAQVCDFFHSKTNFRKTLLDEILFQADENVRKCPGIYSDNHRKLITRYFNPDRFYLMNNSVAFYFQLYEIAPYVSGIVTLSIPFDQLGCPPVCQQQRKLYPCL